MSQDQYTQQDPTTAFEQPDYPEQAQSVPGLSVEMDPQPDYGEATYRGSGRLQGKKAVVTGGDSGIGRAVALAFAREGADVLISYLPEEEPDAQETVRLVEAAGRKAVTVPGDIQQRAVCEQIVATAVREFGQIDVLVNNAAYQSTVRSIGEITDEDFDRVMKTNVYAMFWLTRAAVPHMRPGASVINSCSVEGYKPEPKLLHYATSKGAIITFTKGLAQELIEKGVRVNSVAPGPVWTPLIPATMPPEEVKSFGTQSPIGRAAQPVELSPAYVFLASQEASYVNGETLGVTGGMPIP